MVKWGYLWAVLSRFGFGPRFLTWLQILYAQPRVRIRTNGNLSELFSLGRGTRQGCPLSLALFALEPLAILLRMDLGVRDIRVGQLEEKLSLYAGDSLLYLADTSTSLRSALTQIDKWTPTHHYAGWVNLRIWG